MIFIIGTFSVILLLLLGIGGAVLLLEDGIKSKIIDVLFTSAPFLLSYGITLYMGSKLS